MQATRGRPQGLWPIFYGARRWFGRAAVVAAAAVIVSACADDGPSTARIPVPVDDHESTAQVRTGTSASLDATVANGEFFPAPREDHRAPYISLTPIGGVTLPTDLAQRAGDPALYVVSQVGQVVRLVDGNAAPVLDLADWTTAHSEMGLLGLEFSPGGDLAYFSHTAAEGGALTVVEIPVTPEGAFERDSARALLSIYQPSRFHQGGDLEFGPDGMLYIATGDGGPGYDPDRRALALDNMLGKILRIDPTPSDDLPFTVPPDNPYYGVDGVRQEIWASGLRNPWKFTFDSSTGDLWIADVGEAEVEEVNHLPASDDGSVPGRGVSFGWSAFEGNTRFYEDEPVDGHTAPALVYNHGDDGCAVAGGAPYRGAAIDGLQSAYVYSDWCSGKIWAFYPDTGANVLLARSDGATGVIAGEDGELYVLHRTGSISRVDPG